MHFKRIFEIFVKMVLQLVHNFLSVVCVCVCGECHGVSNDA